MGDLTIQSMDDVQLSIYLAQKNFQGQPAIHITNCADQILNWIKDTRQGDHQNKVEN